MCFLCSIDYLLRCFLRLEINHQIQRARNQIQRDESSNSAAFRNPQLQKCGKSQRQKEPAHVLVTALSRLISKSKAIICSSISSMCTKSSLFFRVAEFRINYHQRFVFGVPLHTRLFDDVLSFVAWFQVAVPPSFQNSQI